MSSTANDVEPRLRLALPWTDEDEIQEIRQVLASGYLAQGPKAVEFERMVADFVGAKYVFATSSCTTALHLSLVALGIGRGDEVLVPDFTFPATANVVVQQGARPVLVDIDLDTFTMDVEDLKAKVTPRSKAIMPVHAFGLSADMDAIMAVAREHGLCVVEDAACAIGATYYGKHCGTVGTVGCFSFHARKVITTGEGGMIATNDDSLAERIQLLRNHGGVRTDNRFTFEAAGFNYRMSDIQAAVGVGQMRKLGQIIHGKRELASELGMRIQDVASVTIPKEPAWGGHIYQSYVVLLDEQIERDTVIQLVKQRGIETTLGTYALHAEPFFATRYGYRPGDLPNSYQAYRRSLTLPSYPPMEAADLGTIVESLEYALEMR